MKIKASLSVLLLLLISITNVYAQAGPPPEFCPDGVTPYTPDGCPLDTWVIVLVAAACVFAAYKLNHRKRLTC